MQNLSTIFSTTWTGGKFIFLPVTLFMSRQFCKAGCIYIYAITLRRINGTDWYYLDSENRNPIKLQTDDQWRNLSGHLITILRENAMHSPNTNMSYLTGNESQEVGTHHLRNPNLSSRLPPPQQCQITQIHLTTQCNT